MRARLALLATLPLLLVGSGAVAGNSPTPRNGLIAASGPEGISLIDPQTSAQRLIAKTEDAEVPTWSPDGRQLAFELWDESGTSVYSVRADGTDLRLVLKNAWSPSWSPDSKQLVVARETCYQDPCSADDFPTSNLFLVDAAGGSPRQLTFVADDADSPEWSPDGKWIAFMGADGIDLVQPEEMAEPEHVRSRWLLGVDDTAYDFAWSPDGAWIAFAGDNGLYRVRPPFGDAERLTGDEGVEHLAWSPDGAKIAFDRSEEASPEMEIVLLDVVTRKQTGLTRPLAGFAATWSPDGEQLAFLHGAGELWTMNADGKYPRRLAKDDFASLSWGVDVPGLTR